MGPSFESRTIQGIKYAFEKQDIKKNPHAKLQYYPSVQK